MSNDIPIDILSLKKENYENNFNKEAAKEFKKYIEETAYYFTICSYFEYIDELENIPDFIRDEYMKIPLEDRRRLIKKRKEILKWREELDKDE